jgi:hypothetical protein
MITIVSGLPRSGTSLMMQMLSAAGLPLLTDGIRQADSENARGYFEWEPAKELSRNPALIAQAEGKAVKVISALLPFVPRAFDYRVLLMRRNLSEVAASQRDLIAKLGTFGPPVALSRLEATLAHHDRYVCALLSQRPDLSILRVQHDELLRDSSTVASRVADYLGVTRRANVMARVVDRSLHRHKSC